jgi:biopolymer transport protein ExbB/TolQ
MSRSRKLALPKVLDAPLAIAALATVAYYLLITQDSLKHTLLYRYTAEHIVEYVVVSFFMWGLADIAFRVLNFPREMLALRQDLLPRPSGREPVSNAAALLALVQRKPQWVRESRLGQRMRQALIHVQQSGSADDFVDYLRNLADQDYERTQSNYGVTRFLCWVTPMFGFLGTVIHFGTALGGEAGSDIGEKLPTVVAEMGTAFNTTTVALIAATTMMFCLFLGERTERAIISSVDARAERDLANRFEVLPANMAPFMSALGAANRATIETVESAVGRQLELLANALQTWQSQQSRVWVEALEKLEARFEANDQQREQRSLRLLQALEQQASEQRVVSQSSGQQLADLTGEMGRLVEQLTGIFAGKGELVKLQASLADNLKLLHDTQQLDQALHGLTAAIHLMTARGGTAAESRRAA